MPQAENKFFNAIKYVPGVAHVVYCANVCAKWCFMAGETPLTSEEGVQSGKLKTVMIYLLDIMFARIQEIKRLRP